MRDRFINSLRAIRPLGLPLAALMLLSGCQEGILAPKGPIGESVKSLIWTATWLMLLIVVPVIVLTLVFAWKYRSSNKAARYEPRWDHSKTIEAVVWLVPCAIIVALGILTYRSTHALDPYKPIESNVRPVQVQVVSLDWKWLFIYPEYGIATVNEMAMPVNTPVQFSVTSGSVMNTFFIPQLGSMIYSMAGMTTKLNLQADEVGAYDGLSAHYSGAGFSGMKFKAHATDQAGFDAWVAKVRASGNALDMPAYKSLAVQSENNPVAYYGSVTPAIFGAILHDSAPGMTPHHQMAASPAAPPSQQHAGGHMAPMQAADAGHSGHKE